MGLMRYPSLSALGGIGTFGVGGFGEICLVLFIQLTIAFTQDEHTPWLQASDHLSSGLGEICYLRIALERI